MAAARFFNLNPARSAIGGGNQASGLVLRSPVTRSPGFHSPRFLSKSTRSKRFKTLRLAPRVEAARRLRCCDIKLIDSIQPALPGRVLTRRRHSAGGKGGDPIKTRLLADPPHDAPASGTLAAR